MTQPMPPPGWYPDPAGQGSRYWDGGRWTEHTQASAPTPPVPAPLAGARGVPPPPRPGTGSGGYAPVPVTVVTSSPFAGFGDQLRRLEPFALVVVGFVAFVLTTFLPWYRVEGGGVEDSGSGWNGEGPWLIRGYDVQDGVDAIVATAGGQAVSTPSGGTDLIILLPLALIAVGLVVAFRQGKKVQYGREIATGAAGLLTILLIAETWHLGNWFGDVKDQGERAIGRTIDLDGGAAWGLYLAVLASGVMTFGAVRALLAERAR